MKNPHKMFWLLAALFIVLGVCYAAFDSNNNSSACKLEETLLGHEDVLEVTSVYLPMPLLEALTEFAESANSKHSEFVIYRIKYSSDGYRVMGYVAAPADFMEHEYPILIINRGGNRDFGSLTYAQVISFALRGYIVLGSQYRGVAGGTGIEQFGGDDINDVLRLIDISESFAFAQQGGVYMFGASRGGMMTYIASRMDCRIRAATVWAANSNIFYSFNERGYDMRQVLVELIGGAPNELPEEFERRSAVFWADEIKVPLLIGHGGDTDWRVPTHHSINMAAALERYGKPHRLIIYPDAGHEVVMDFLDEMDEWFRQHPISEYANNCLQT
ncbi:MAG: prolyl oligopeptidase family serine peptidase [Defluviitaleaceae bacterium]|nr:prolyl oligopeptidase family serine peptidase [Defluviitaleaceae bacterium]